MSDVNIKELISQMTLEEKIGQLVQLSPVFFGEKQDTVTGPLASFGISEDYLSKVGSVLNFSNPNDIIKTQKKHIEDDRNNIPLIFMQDVIHGFRTIYPIGIALGSSFDEETVTECTKMAAREAAASGIHLTFAPMVDYCRDARWGRLMEATGEDPYLNSVMGAAQIKAFRGESISDRESLATCVKHFAGYGGAEAGRDYNTVEISERLLREYYFPAYKACIDAGADAVMPSFNSLNGVPSTANRWLIRGVLRGEWGFDGVVISDYNALGELEAHGVASGNEEIAEMAFNNGCDIEMMSSAYCTCLEKLVNSKKVKEADIDKAVERILKLKKELGLFDDPYHGASPERAEKICLCPEHRDIARRAAESCALLLKNNGILPFSADVKRIALIGPFAANNAIKGFWAFNGRNEDCVTVEEGIRALLPNAEVSYARGCDNLWNSCSEDGFDEAIKIAEGADIVILCLGEPQHYSGEGNSRTDLKLPGVQEKLAREIMNVNKNTAVLLFHGRPLVLTELEKTVPAILSMWFPGSEGGNAAANLLFGKADPSGKVSMSFPKAVGQCPIYYNHPSTGRPKPEDKENEHISFNSNYIDCGNLPLYSFGYGLSYTSFEYLSLDIDKTEMTRNESISVKITVKNTGERTGKEVVQLYMHDKVASTVRPVASLIGFKKIELLPGEEKTVEFIVTEDKLRLYNAGCECVSELGEFELFTGYADNFILKKSIWLK